MAWKEPGGETSEMVDSKKVWSSSSRMRRELIQRIPTGRKEGKRQAVGKLLSEKKKKRIKTNGNQKKRKEWKEKGKKGLVQRV